MPRPRKPNSPFRYFNSSPEIIRLVVMMYVRFPSTFGRNRQPDSHLIPDR